MPLFVRLTVALFAAALLLSPVGAAPALSPQPQGAEIAFVAAISKDLTARFPTPADAEKAGYFRYTNEDEDGAISFTNLHWQSGSPKQPSQLWYDIHGNLLGADYSVLQSSSPEPPAVWGVSFRRWTSFRQHLHYTLNGPNGAQTYGATSITKFMSAGGDAANPQAATLVKMGIAKDPADVKRVFLFPSVWDLIVWVKRNPLGAFAGRNPLVTPSANADKADM